jgi:hypothetical protein
MAAVEQKHCRDNADHGDGESATDTERERRHVSSVPGKASRVGDAIVTNP